MKIFSRFAIKSFAVPNVAVPMAILFAIAVLGAAMLGAAAAQAQALPAKSRPLTKLGGMDVGVAGTGQFTTSITNQTYGSAGELLTHNSTTDSPGALFTLRAHPAAWAGVELNYQYTRYSERFFNTTLPKGEVNVPTSVHEASGAYLVHVKVGRLKPYLGVGGGELWFEPPAQVHHQARAAGLVDFGLDMQTHSNLGFRIGARDLLYRAPNFYSAQLSSSRWVSAEEPYGGVYVRF